MQARDHRGPSGSWGSCPHRARVHSPTDSSHGSRPEQQPARGLGPARPAGPQQSRGPGPEAPQLRRSGGEGGSGPGCCRLGARWSSPRLGPRRPSDGVGSPPAPRGMAPQGSSGLQRTGSRTWPPACPRGPQASGERGGSPRSGVITAFNTNFSVGATLSTKDLISSGKVPNSPSGHQQ